MRPAAASAFSCCTRTSAALFSWNENQKSKPLLISSAVPTSATNNSAYLRNRRRRGGAGLLAGADPPAPAQGAVPTDASSALVTPLPRPPRINNVSDCNRDWRWRLPARSMVRADRFLLGCAIEWSVRREDWDGFRGSGQGEA